jgi:hypothetical protein
MRDMLHIFHSFTGVDFGSSQATLSCAPMIIPYMFCMHRGRLFPESENPF